MDADIWPSGPSGPENLSGVDVFWSKPSGAALLVIATVALAFRLVLVLGAIPDEASDAGEYRDLAIGLVEHGTYARIGNSGWDTGLNFQAYRPPGYPFVRAALMVTVGRDPRHALRLNVLAEMVALLFIVAAARRVVGDRGAVWAALLFTPLVLATATLMTESISIALWAALTWAYVRGPAANGPRGALLVGVILAAAILVRPVSIIWVPTLAGAVLARRPRDWRALLALGAASLVFIGAWILRNYGLFSTFVWSSTNLGMHNCYEYGIPWTRFRELRDTGLNEAQADRALLWEIVGRATSRPYETLDLFRGRLVNLFAVSISGTAELEYQNVDVFPRSPWSLFVRDWGAHAMAVEHVLAFVGVAAAAWNHRLRERSLLIPLGLFVGLHTLISRGDARLVAPILPILCIFGAGAMNRLWGTRRPPPPRRYAHAQPSDL